MTAARDPLLQLLQAVIREPNAPETLRAHWPELVDRFDLEPRDRAALLDVSPDRVLVYRKLVFNRICSAVREFIPRTVARMGRTVFRDDIAAFIAECGPSSPYLRDVPGEFVRWAAPRWLAERTRPAYLVDLARHELLDFEVRNDPRGGEAPTGAALALEAPLRFDGSARLMEYAYAVHRLSSDPTDHAAPEATPARLLVYRDADDRVRYLELSVFAASMLHALIEQRRTVAEALKQCCDTRGESLDDAQLATAADLLADLADRGVMLGAETEQAGP